MNENNTGGIGFIGALTLIFITLKLTSVISWSWAWVLSPIWIGFLFWAVILILVFVIASMVGD